VFQQVPDGYIGFVAELPAANTQGATLEEARANLQEAVQLVLESNGALWSKKLSVVERLSVSRSASPLREAARPHSAPEAHGCEWLRAGGNHSVYNNRARGRTSTVPRRGPKVCAGTIMMTRS
jgi:predicted RNase H-like HicB family nuclease